MNFSLPAYSQVLALDVALVVFIFITTFAVFWNWPQVRTAGAAQGAILIVIGLWGIGLVHLLEVLELMMASRLGDPNGGAPHTGLAGRASQWRVDVFAALFVSMGLFSLIRKVMMHFDDQSRLLGRFAERENRLNDAARLAKIGFYIFDITTDRVVYCTDQHAASNGLSETDYFNQAPKLSNGLTLIHAEDRGIVSQAHLRVRDGETVEFEYRVPTRAGERRVREIITPVFGAEGKVVRSIGTSQDVTDQREMEILLQQSIKMEAVGNLTGGIAHDFNNLLAVILGNLELAKELPSDLDELLDEAVAATLKGAELTKSMLSFARRAPLEPTVLDLNKIVLEIMKWAARGLPPSIKCETSLLAGLWPVRADRNSTESALLNLILNARDAMQAGGKLTLETANVRIDEDYIDERQEDLEVGRYVMLAVSDTGVGIVPEILDRIFEPFFSTKGPGKGSGLGLSMIQGFMKQSGGGVRVYSEPGAGTTFKLYFRAAPQTTGDAGAIVQVADKVAKTPGGKTILLAEDEPAVREMLVRTLGDSGFNVISAPSGDAALARFEAAQNVDLVLTDIVMPGALQGPALVQALRQRDASLPAVFMSGYANEATVHGNGLRPEDIRLMKPISRSLLLSAIKQAMAPD